MSGGFGTYKEDYRTGDGWEYFCRPMLLSFFIFLDADYFFRADTTLKVIDFSTGIQFPVLQDNPLARYFDMGYDVAQGTQGDALWWDGGDYIYK